MKIRRPAPRSRGKAPRGRIAQPRPTRHPARHFQNDPPSPQERERSSGD